jgi:ketosteroid isomerase-like protein
MRRAMNAQGEWGEIMRDVARVSWLLILLSLVTVQAALAQDDRPELMSELQELMVKMDRAMVDGDYEAVAKFYADDAVVLPNNSPRIEGRAALQGLMEENREAGVNFGSFTGTVDRAWECGGMVYAVGSYALSADVPGLERPVADKGKTFTVFRRRANGKLEIVYDIWNTDIEMGK